MRYSYVPASDAAHIADRDRPELLVSAPAPFRIIVPNRTLRDVEAKRVPDVARLSAMLLDAGGEVIESATYAVAEEIATATLIESVALRFVLADGRSGVAFWWDWSWRGAVLRWGEEGKLSLEHLEALITGAVWPPPVYPCPRCATAVRRNRDGSVRAHGPKRKCRGYWPSLMDCCYGKPVERG